MAQNNNYLDLIEQYHSNRDNTPFPIEEMFCQFDDTSALVEDLIDSLDDNWNRNTTIVRGALKFWKSLRTEPQQLHSCFPFILWSALQEFVANRNFEPGRQRIKTIIQSNLCENFQDICSALILDFLRSGRYDQKRALRQLYGTLTRERNDTELDIENLNNLAIQYRIQQLLSDNDHPHMFLGRDGEEIDGEEIIDKYKRAWLRNHCRPFSRDILDERRHSAEAFFQNFECRYSSELCKGHRPLKLSEKQKNAIIFPHRHSLIRSSAGSGKTTVLIARFFYLIEVLNVSPSEILLLVYNRKVRREINDKIKILWQNTYGNYDEIWPGNENYLDEEENVERTTASGPAKTFHVAALDIVGQITGKRPTPLQAQERTEDLIRTCILENCLDDNKIVNLLPERQLLYYRNTYLPFSQERDRIFSEEGRIDFPGMIELANTLLEGDEEVLSGYRYILIDEYQDITQNRHRFLKNLVKHGNGTGVFCVGDDWQSIYSFTESDLNLFVEFQYLWGEDAYTYDLDETFRFGEPLACISNRFVLNQRTTTLARRTTTGIGETRIGLIPYQLDGDEQNNDNWRITHLHIQLEMIMALLRGQIQSDNITKCRVAIINRFKLTEDVRGEFERFRNGFMDYPDVEIEYVTMHSSKGETYDYAFIVNCNGSAIRKIVNNNNNQDLDFRPFLRNMGEDARIDEERRLFYVAITRAKRKVFLLYDEEHQSCFVSEIRELLSGF